VKIGELILQLVVQGKDAAAELRKYDSEQRKTEAGSRKLDATTKAFGSTLKKLTLMIGGVYGVYRLLTTTIKSAITKSNAQEEAEARLTAALRIHGRATEENIAALKRLAAERQRITKFGDEETLSAMAMLGTFDLEVATIKKMTPLMQDIATMTSKTTGEQIGLENAAKLVGMAMEGQAGRLKQAGISVRKYEDELKAATTDMEKASLVIKILEENAGGMAEAVGQTDAAAFKQLTNAIGDNLEKMGNWIKKGLGPAARLLTDLISSTKEESDALTRIKSKSQIARIEFDRLADSLLKLASKEKLSAEEMRARNSLIDDLKSKYPNYLSNLDKEKDGYRDIAQKISDARTKLEDYYRQQIALATATQFKDQIADIAVKMEGYQTALDNYNKGIYTTFKINKEQTVSGAAAAKHIKDRMAELKQQIDLLQQSYDRAYKKALEFGGVEPPETPPPPSDGDEKVKLTEAEAKAQFEINRILAERGGIQSEIKFWTEVKNGLDETDLEQKLQILIIEDKIAGLIEKQKEEQKKLTDEQKRTLAQQEAAVDLANQLSNRFADALVTQWQQGKSAIKAWGDVVSQMIQQIAAEILAKAAVWALFSVVTGGTGASLGKFIFSGNLSSIGTLAGFQTGGYTGDGDPSQIAGVTHKREVVFESSITHQNLPELLALRSALQRGYNLGNLMQPRTIIVQGGPDYDFERLERRLDTIAEKVNQPPQVKITSNVDAQKFYEDQIIPAANRLERKVT